MADAQSDLKTQIDNITQGNPDVTGIIIDIAKNIDISWIEWSVKLAIAAIVFLCFKEIIFSIYRYIILRVDKYICIGTIIKFNHGVYGKIQDYNLRHITIITHDGIVKIPLNVWLSTYYTQVTSHDINVSELIDITKLADTNQKQDEKLQYLYTEMCDVKKNLEELVKPKTECP